MVLLCPCVAYKLPPMPVDDCPATPETTATEFAVMAANDARLVAEVCCAKYASDPFLGQRLISTASDAGRHFTFTNFVRRESPVLIAWNVAYWTRVSELLTAKGASDET